VARNFDNWLTAFCEYADDGFLPPQFNLWAGLSVIAGALERRVWLPWSDTYSFFPNIYVLLVSMPGDGKSVALGKATGLLQEVNRRTSTLNMIPSQVTEAKFIELMGHGRTFTERRGDREIIHRQNAGYYWASEASNSLKNIFGDFIACLTDFYDCPPTWERATKKDGKKIQLTNVCMNLIAGSTFDYLGKLVNDENIMGGFASRLIYVVSKNKEVKAQAFQLGQTPEMQAERKVYREALIADLTEISKLVGVMTAAPEFARAWETWYPIFETKRRAMESEKTQSILARANTNILKVAMLLSAAESDSRVLTLEHWHRAHDMVMAIQEETPSLFQQVRANGTSKSPTQVTSALLLIMKKYPGISIESAKAKAVLDGHNPLIVDKTAQALITDKVVGMGNVVAGQGGGIETKVFKKADDYL